MFLSHRRKHQPLRVCILWSVYAQTQQSLSGWPAIWREGSQLGTCPESECKHGLCRATPSLVLGRAVLDPAFRTPYPSYCHSAALPFGGTHPFRRSSPPCHMPLLPSPQAPPWHEPPGSLQPPHLSSWCWAGPRAGVVCLPDCMSAAHRWAPQMSFPPGVISDTVCHGFCPGV